MESRVTDGPGLGRYTPPADSAAPDPVVAVHLRDVPVRIWKRSAEHHDELMREMALLALADETSQALPARLVELIDVLGRRYGGASERPEAERDDAIAAGVDRIDLTTEVPASAGGAAAVLGALLLEVEEFCRDGDQLLTLAQPAVQAHFNAWYLEQFTTQCAGGDPTPWTGPWD
ncbi:MAG: hypothetical protein Q8R60_04710 [Mycobacteriales bacterium]|nr:hypothetical protein [Mycobacteriales bacterium]